MIAVLIGRPNDANWDQIHASAAEALESARASCSFPPEDAVHRRGAYAAIARGISYGGGQLRPGNLANSPRNRRVVDALASHQSFVRIAGFASGKPQYHTAYVSTYKLSAQVGLPHGPLAFSHTTTIILDRFSNMTTRSCATFRIASGRRRPSTSAPARPASSTGTPLI